MRRSRSPHFSWVPEFAQGVVRDLRARWALEEAGLDYRVRLLGQDRPPEYLREQPFDQVPCLNDGDVRIFESGAIVQYIGEKSRTLLPNETRDRYRAIQWTYAALNSVEPAILNLLLIDIFYKGEEWAKLRRPGAEDFAKLKLKRVSEWLGDKRVARGPLHDRRPGVGHSAALPSAHRSRRRFPQPRRLSEAGRSPPAFQRALADQLATLRGQSTPTRRSSSMSYIDGFVLPVTQRQGRRISHASREFAGKSTSKARSEIEALGDDLEHGHTTDFFCAVQATDDENVVFSFIVWPDEATRDQAWEKLMADPEMQPGEQPMPFDGKRMFWGGFQPLLNTLEKVTEAA